MADRMTTELITPEKLGRPLTVDDVQEGDTCSIIYPETPEQPFHGVTFRKFNNTLVGLGLGIWDWVNAGWTITSISRPVVPEQVELPSEEAAWRKAIADQVRRNCTPPNEAYEKGGDVMIYAVADWIENPPEWSKFTPPADSGREAAIAEVIDWFEAQGLGGYWIQNAKKYFALVPEAEGEKA